MTATRVKLGALGLLLGFSLSRIGFSSWDEVHAMFRFTDLRLFLTFVSGVVTLGVAWVVVKRVQHPEWSPREVHRGTLPGGILFGIGWALCGACPAIALVQIGEGQLGGVVTLAGILAGNWLYASRAERSVRVSPEACA